MGLSLDVTGTAGVEVPDPPRPCHIADITGLVWGLFGPYGTPNSSHSSGLYPGGGVLIGKQILNVVVIYEVGPGWKTVILAPGCPGIVEVVVVIEVVVVVRVEGIGHAAGDGQAVAGGHAVGVGQTIDCPPIVVVVSVPGGQLDMGGQLEPEGGHSVGGTVILVVIGVQDDPGPGRSHAVGKIVVVDITEVVQDDCGP